MKRSWIYALAIIALCYCGIFASSYKHWIANPGLAGNAIIPTVAQNYILVVWGIDGRCPLDVGDDGLCMFQIVRLKVSVVNLGYIEPLGLSPSMFLLTSGDMRFRPSSFWSGCPPIRNKRMVTGMINYEIPEGIKPESLHLLFDAPGYCVVNRKWTRGENADFIQMDTESEQ
jgi:hypothetical protein